MKASSGFIQRQVTRLRPHAARPWFPPAMSISAAIDYVFFAASPQLLLIATVLLRGRRWRVVPWCFALASALGAVAVTVTIGWLGETVVAAWGDGADALPVGMTAFVRDWGLIALFILCALPLSMRSPVFLVALGGVPAAQIGLAVFGGRLVAYHLIAVAVLQFPSRWPRLRAMVAELTEPPRAAEPAGVLDPQARRAPE